jgi:membrane dipeptidase
MKLWSLEGLFLSVVATGSLLGAGGIPQEESTLREQARRLHREVLVLDTHADLTPFLKKDTEPPLITEPDLSGPAYDPAADPLHAPVLSNWMRSFPPGPWRFTERHSDGYMDLPRIRDGGLDAEFFAIFMEREVRPGMAVKRSLGQIEAIRAAADKYPDHMALATTAEEVRQIVESGRLAALMGVEGGHMIEDDLRVLRMYHALGVRYMTLTHCFNTHWADSSGCGGHVEAEHGGLSPFGEEVVREMNRLGMIVDVSHVADETFFDVMENTRAPVIASHSSVDGVKDHARNMSDEMLEALASNGGVIQINAVIKYIDPVERESTPLSVFIDHIEHAVRVAGPDHVGIGLDYGYTAPAPVGLEDVSKLETVTYELLKRGFDKKVVRKIWGENTLRVMTEVERIASTSERPVS